MGRWFKPEMIAILYINAPAKISHLAVIRRLTNFLFKLIQLKTESLRIGAKSLALNATCAGVGRRNQLLKQHVEQHWYFYWYCYFQDMDVYVYIYIYIYKIAKRWLLLSADVPVGIVGVLPKVPIVEVPAMCRGRCVRVTWRMTRLLLWKMYLHIKSRWETDVYTHQGRHFGLSGGSGGNGVFQKTFIVGDRGEIIRVGFRLVGESILHLNGDFKVVVVVVEDFELVVKAFVRLVQGYLNRKIYFLWCVSLMLVEKIISTVSGCLFKMVMWADFLRLLLFSDSCRLGKVKSVKVEMKVVVEMVVGVA